MVKKICVYLSILVTLLIVIYLFVVTVLYPKKYSNYVEDICSRYEGVDPYLIYAVIKQESNFNEKAVSPKGAQGLMQLLPSTAKEMAESTRSINSQNFDLLNAEENLELGIRYIDMLIKQYNGNIYIAIAAYNAGMGNVNKWFKEDFTSYDTYEKIIQNIEFGETRKYVSNIIKYYNMYKKIY